MQPALGTTPSGGMPAGIRRKRGAGDMNQEDWGDLVGGLEKFFAEEADEPEHAEDDAPRSLYVSRPLKNASDVAAWAEKAGIKNLLPAEDMHVTVAYSRSPMSWPQAADDAVTAPDAGGELNGTRSLETFDKGAAVLRFDSPDLARRWQELRDAGASWDHEGYRPHVTLSYDPGVDVASIEPFPGALEFGPEQMAEVDDGWADKHKPAADEDDDEDDLPAEAGGVAFVTPDGWALFVRYGPDHGSNPGQWAFPGGTLEEGERPIEAAHREAVEETGRAPGEDMALVDRSADHGADYSTFKADVPGRFIPKIGAEHDKYAWAPLSKPPQPLHSGVAALLKRSTGEDGMPVLGGGQSPLDSGAEPEVTLDADLTGKESAAGKLSDTTRAAIGAPGSETRGDMPDDAFLEPGLKKYPVKEKRDDGWKYSRKLLLAAARRARMEGAEAVAKHADEIREREFGNAADAADFDAPMDNALRIAMDRDSVRDFDQDGRLHVQVANISKANICPYVGKEIPRWEELGLDPDKLYRLLRDPEELAKGASTFNGIQLLRRHEPVSVDDHRMWDIVGTTGSGAKFEAPYLRNSLHVWTKEGINLIESEAQKELSSGYHYDADMTPGEYDGQPFDGTMRNIVGNHVALVKDGRVGSDVVVGDGAEEVQWAMIEAALKEMGVAA